MPGKYLRRISVRFAKTFSKRSGGLSPGRAIPRRYFMNYSSLKSLTGFPWAQIEVELDRELPPDAYSPVPGGAGLTDIDPAYMRDEFNRLFGVCGIGWGYHYDVADVEYEVVKRGQGSATSAIVKKVTVWFKLLDDTGKEHLLEVQSSGGSVNDNAGYALSGAITNAIGKAASNIGFQKSVYLGLRSHKTVSGKPTPKPATKPMAQKPAPKPAPKPATKPMAQEDDEILDDPVDDLDNAQTAVSDLENFVIPVGKRKGQKLGSQPLNVISFYAHMDDDGDERFSALKAAAEKLLKIRSNGHAVPA
jgi:hypothetical protein